MALIHTLYRLKVQVDTLSVERENRKTATGHIGQAYSEDGNIIDPERGMTIIPSLHPSPTSFPDCLPSLYFCNSERKVSFLAHSLNWAEHD